MTARVPPCCETPLGRVYCPAVPQAYRPFACEPLFPKLVPLAMPAALGIFRSPRSAESHRPLSAANGAANYAAGTVVLLTQWHGCPMPSLWAKRSNGPHGWRRLGGDGRVTFTSAILRATWEGPFARPLGPTGPNLTDGGIIPLHEAHLPRRCPI